jgi:uridine kinase
MAVADFDDIVRRIEQLVTPALIGIDGLPCSGKSTLADRLERHFGIETISLDDFVYPESQWPRDARPAFPFEYIRYDEFVRTVETLALTGTATYVPFDWTTFEPAAMPRTVRLDRLALVEGVSALNPVLAPLYGLRIFVESDRSTTIEAALARGVGQGEELWRDLFMPSADLYMLTGPQSRADLIFRGRGAKN